MSSQDGLRILNEIRNAGPLLSVAAGGAQRYPPMRRALAHARQWHRGGKCR